MDPLSRPSGRSVSVYAYHPGGNKDMWIAHNEAGKMNAPGFESVLVARASDESEANAVIDAINARGTLPDGSAIQAIE